MNKTDLAYFAGFFDGEGCITIRNTKRANGRIERQLCVSIGNTNEWIISQIQFSFDGYIWHNKAHDNNRDKWQLILTSRKALNLLESLLPYLTIKRAEAELGIKFQKRKVYRGSRRLPSKERVLEEAEQLLLRKMKRP